MTQEDTTIYYKKQFRHNVSKVFSAFATPQNMLQWWHINNFKNTKLELDFSEGGDYEIEMELPNGHRFSITGVYQKIETNKTIQFTFNYVNFPKKSPGESIVTIDFVDKGDESEILFRQKFSTRPEDMDGRTKVWEAMFTTLYSVLDEI